MGLSIYSQKNMNKIITAKDENTFATKIREIVYPIDPKWMPNFVTQDQLNEKLANIDLTNYYNKDEVDSLLTALNTKINILTAEIKQIKQVANIEVDK
jgi:hypothetical protein